MGKSRLIFIVVLLFVMLIMSTLIPVTAQTNFPVDNVLTLNTGTDSTIWFISGEPSVVMNGFDLQPLNLQYPVVVDAVYIEVETAVPGAAVDVLIYQDANGGSPVDAQLVQATATTIDTTGLVRVPLLVQAEITAPVLWVALYLPVDFQFLADTSGSSVLTYWAWTPGTTFATESLGNASVLGPAEGSDPVGLDMGGIARISAEIRQTVNNEIVPLPLLSASSVASTAGTSSGGFNLTPGIQAYGGCPNVGFDPADIAVSGRGQFSLYCRSDAGPVAPPTGFKNLNAINVSNFRELERRNEIVEIVGQGAYQAAINVAEQLRVPVTHCIAPRLGDTDQNPVMAIAHGVPRTWQLLPTEVINGNVCAEVTHTGYLTYFIRRSGFQSNLNANLVFAYDPIIEPFPFECGQNSKMTVSILNEGFETTQGFRLIVADKVVDTTTGADTIIEEFTWDIPPIEGGQAFEFSNGDFFVAAFPNSTHRIEFIIDPDNFVTELDEQDNKWEFQYFYPPSFMESGFCPTPVPGRMN